MVMKKIVVIGSSGAGKSTFAQALGEILNIEVLHLDRYFWRSGWKEYPREERIRIQQELVRGKEQWIMEGSYISSADGRLDAADTIIFLDMPRLLCLWRAIKRHITTYRQYRLDLPDGCTDKLSLRCVAKVLVFPHYGLKQFMRKINLIREREAHQPQQKAILFFHSAKDVDAFLYHLQEQKPSVAVEHGYTLGHLSEPRQRRTPTLSHPLAQGLPVMLPYIPHIPLSIDKH